MIINVTDKYLNNYYSFVAPVFTTYNFPSDGDSIVIAFLPKQDNVWNSYIRSHVRQPYPNMVHLDKDIAAKALCDLLEIIDIENDIYELVDKCSSNIKTIEASVKKVKHHGQYRFITTVDKIEFVDNIIF